MNKERLKKLIYDLEITEGDIEKSINLIKKYSDDEDLKGEFSNSLKYKYLSLFIVYEDFISMLLKEYSLYEIAISVDSAIKKLKNKGIISEEVSVYLNSARLIRNKIGHRYKQPAIESVIEFLEENKDIKSEFHKLIKNFL
ncbi:MAG: hypothetical protein ACRC2K_05275 [Clostridium sp.]